MSGRRWTISKDSSWTVRAEGSNLKVGERVEVVPAADLRSLEDQLATLQAAVDLLLVARRPVAPSSPHKYLPDNPETRLFLDRLVALGKDSERLGKLEASE